MAVVPKFLTLFRTVSHRFGGRILSCATAGSAAILLAACTPMGGQSVYPQGAGQIPQGDPLFVGGNTPGSGVQNVPTVALALPISGQHAAIGADMRQAAQMAVEDANSQGVQFSLVDTQSTLQGAQSAASAAVNGGAKLILGPLLGDSLGSMAQIAGPRGVSVLGFTNDVGKTRPGAWAMGLAPEQSVGRVMQWAAANNKRRVAVMAPSTPYGQAALNAASTTARQYGVSITAQGTYGPDDISKNDTARTLAEQRDSFDAVLIADSGNALREVSSLLYFYEVEPTEKTYMGLEGWDDASLRTEQSLVNGIFSAPPTGNLSRFEQRYQQRFGKAPSVQAATVYDSVMLVTELATINTGQTQRFFGLTPNPFSIEQLTRAQGFNGVLGSYRLNANGRIERLFDIKQVTPSGIQILERADNGFTNLGLPAG